MANSQPTSDGRSESLGNVCSHTSREIEMERREKFKATKKKTESRQRCHVHLYHVYIGTSFSHITRLGVNACQDCLSASAFACQHREMGEKEHSPGEGILALEKRGEERRERKDRREEDK